jgi:hypothetical protein
LAFHHECRLSSRIVGGCGGRNTRSLRKDAGGIAGGAGIAVKRGPDLADHMPLYRRSSDVPLASISHARRAPLLARAAT